MAEKDRTVCVTGAGGYVASCLIKLLLSQGHTVHGTVRNPESLEQIEDNLRKIVDVRDVAEALKLVYETPLAEGRYICMAHMIKSAELMNMLKTMYPNYEYPDKATEGKDELRMSSEKLQKLGWN